MAISPNLGQAAARQVADYYLNAEVALLQRYAKYLTQGLTLTDWEQSKLAQLQALRNMAWNQLDAANKQAESAIRNVVDDAYQQGSLSAYQDASRYLPDVPWNAPARTAAVETIAKAATGAIESATVPLLGSADEKIRQAIAQAAGQTATGAQFRKTATQAALNRAFESGLGSVPVGRGVMTLPDYVTMSVRTATTNAGVLGHAQAMQANGFNLCYIQPGPYPCDKCDVWIGKILSLDGSKGILTTTNLVTGEAITVHVAATLDEARSAGWGHPNCRCRLATYIPGVDLAVDRIPESRTVYEASQQQRALERQVRSWKYRQSIAITPRALSEASGAVANYQARLRQLVRENPGLVRQYEREQITGHYGPQPPRTPGGPKPEPPMPSGPPGWQPVMSRAAAEEYMAGTKVRGTYYHGTSPEAYESIRTGGFDAALGGKNTNTALLGHGVYLSGIKEYADEYARYLPGGKPATVEVMVKAERPINILDILKNPDFKGGQFDMYDPDPGVADAISAFAKDHGYDAVYMQYDEFAGKLVRRGPITEIVVADPKQIVVINDGA
jgi:hypothetical protein